MYVCSMLNRPPIYYDHIRLKNPNKYDLSFFKLLQNSLFKLCSRTMLWKMLKVIYTFYCFLIFYILNDLFFVGYYYISYLLAFLFFHLSFFFPLSSTMSFRYFIFACLDNFCSFHSFCETIMTINCSHAFKSMQSIMQIHSCHAFLCIR